MMPASARFEHYGTRSSTPRRTPQKPVAWDRAGETVEFRRKVRRESEVLCDLRFSLVTTASRYVNFTAAKWEASCFG
jgi:hypothetical protein